MILVNPGNPAILMNLVILVNLLNLAIGEFGESGKSSDSGGSCVLGRVMSKWLMGQWTELS